MEVWALSCTMGNPFVRLFTSKQEAAEWGWDWLAERLPESAHHYPRTVDGFEEFVTDSAIPALDWIFIDRAELHDGLFTLPVASSTARAVEGSRS